MDFMIGMLKTVRQHDGVWVIVDRLIKVAHFLLIKATLTSEQLANLYIKEIVRLWCATQYCVRSRYQVCILLLEWFSKSNRHRITFK